MLESSCNFVSLFEFSCAGVAKIGVCSARVWQESHITKVGAELINKATLFSKLADYR